MYQEKLWRILHIFQMLQAMSNEDKRRHHVFCNDIRHSNELEDSFLDRNVFYDEKKICIEWHRHLAQYLYLGKIKITVHKGQSD